MLTAPLLRSKEDDLSEWSLYPKEQKPVVTIVSQLEGGSQREEKGEVKATAADDDRETKQHQKAPGPDADDKPPPARSASNPKDNPPPTPDNKPDEAPQTASEDTSAAAKHPPPPSGAENRLVMVTDLWERMVNMQIALRVFVMYAISSDFTLVEPFVYESKVMNEYSLPEHYSDLGYKPQPISLYFDTRPLFDTGHFINHQSLREKVRLQENHDQFVINAAVLIPWDAPEKQHRGRLLYWCDDEFDKLMWDWPRSMYGRAIMPTFHVQRMLCLNPRLAASANKTCFDELFKFAHSGTKNVKRACGDCVSVVFINYRKHLFKKMQVAKESWGALPGQVPRTLVMGEELKALAGRVKKEMLGGRKYVGIQMRTGKAYSLLRAYDKYFMLDAVENAAFRKWLKVCSVKLVKRAKALAGELGNGTPFYLASDMLNEGWKGGEWASDEVRALLNDSMRYFEEELGNLHWFKPEKFGVTQDVMGVSGGVDAAVAYLADGFVYSKPSSLGLWVEMQRKGMSNAVVDCDDPELGAAQEYVDSLP